MNKDDIVFITSHEGMIGSAIQRRLQKDGFNNLVTKTSKELDLTDRLMVNDFFKDEKPDYIFLNSVRVGGIMANHQYPAEFIYENIQSQTNIIHAAWQHGVKKLLYLGSSCIYPKNSPQPMKEEYLLTGPLESTNEPYAVAKIAGIKMCQAYNRQFGTHFVSVMPATVYGPNDDFDLETSHVIAALIRKFHEAKINKRSKVIVWGTGKPKREFIYLDDLIA